MKFAFSYLLSINSKCCSWHIDPLKLRLRAFVLRWGVLGVSPSNVIRFLCVCLWVYVKRFKVVSVSEIAHQPPLLGKCSSWHTIPLKGAPTGFRLALGLFSVMYITLDTGDRGLSLCPLYL